MDVPAPPAERRAQWAKTTVFAPCAQAGAGPRLWCGLLRPLGLGTMAPGAGMAGLGLALVQRDGVLALIGYAITALSVALVAIGWNVAVAFIGQVARVAGLG